MRLAVYTDLATYTIDTLKKQFHAKAQRRKDRKGYSFCLLRTPAPWNEMFLLLMELFHRASIAWVEVVRIWGMPRYNSLPVGIWKKRSDIMLLCLANLYVCSRTLVANVLAYRMRIGLGVKSPSGNRCPVPGVRCQEPDVRH